MSRHTEDSLGNGLSEAAVRAGVVVAGPGSSLTIPGIIVSELVQAMARLTKVTRIEVDLNTGLMAGLHRAPSLAAVFPPIEDGSIVIHQAPSNARSRIQTFRKLIGPQTAAAVAQRAHRGRRLHRSAHSH